MVAWRKYFALASAHMLRDILFYLLGGVTFIPLCLLSAFVLFSTPLEKESPALPKKSSPLDPRVREEAEQAAVENLADGQAAKLLATWLVVKQSAADLPPKSIVHFGKDGCPKQWRSRDDDDGTVSRGFNMFSKGSRRDRSLAKSAPLVYDPSMPGAIETAEEPSRDTGVYYAILRAPVLYLYNSDNITRPGSECLAAIDLRQKRVSIWSRDAGDVEGYNNERPRAREGELFSKRNAIHIVSFGDSPEPARLGVEAEWYIMAPRTTLQEDWYHALVAASLMAPGRTSSVRNVDTVGYLFSTVDMRDMVASLDDVPDPIPLRWFNALLGRIFFSLYRTAAIENYILNKFMEKILRLRTPRFLTDIRPNSVELGRSPPSFSRPMLKTLTAEGLASMELCVHYKGSLRVTLSAVVNISLGQRFKSYRVPIVLAVVLSRLDGNLLLTIKPPPSNRIWWGFTSMPSMDIEVEPVVSERRVSWSFVNSIIRSRIRESIGDTLVLPHMDDVPFFNTQEEPRRGGIWRESGRSQPNNSPEFRTPCPPSSAPLHPVPSMESLAQANTTRDDVPDGSSAAEGLSTLLRQTERVEISAAQKSASSTRSRFVALKESIEDRRQRATQLYKRTNSPEKQSVENANEEPEPFSFDQEESLPESPAKSDAPRGAPASENTSQKQPPLPARGAGPSMIQQNTSLLASWSQKAKASLADRDARQETAREAKNALKRGWNAWNNRGQSQKLPLPRPSEPPTFVLPKPERAKAESAFSAPDRSAEASNTTPTGNAAADPVCALEPETQDVVAKKEDQESESTKPREESVASGPDENNGEPVMSGPEENNDIDDVDAIEPCESLDTKEPTATKQGESNDIEELANSAEPTNAEEPADSAEPADFEEPADADLSVTVRPSAVSTEPPTEKGTREGSSVADIDQEQVRAVDSEVTGAARESASVAPLADPSEPKPGTNNM